MTQTRILVTGTGSFIGNGFGDFISRYDGYSVDFLDVSVPSWESFDMTGYTAVFHVAAIVHRKEKKADRELYFSVNRDLAVRVAQAAARAGVRQFIFMSTMSVFGLRKGVITPDTPPNPLSFYARSKYEAEMALDGMSSPDFSVCVIRAPMVYGRDCKGNFQKMLRFVRRTPVFPRVNNRRSLIYIDNLSGFVKMAVDRQLSGVYYPQNAEYVSTSDLAVWMAGAVGHHIRLSVAARWATVVAGPFIGRLGHAFGTLIYKDTERFDFCYCTVGPEESVRDSVTEREGD